MTLQRIAAVVHVTHEVELSEEEITLVRRLVIASALGGGAVLIAEGLLSKLPWPAARPEGAANGRLDPAAE